MLSQIACVRLLYGLWLIFLLPCIGCLLFLEAVPNLVWMYAGLVSLGGLALWHYWPNPEASSSPSQAGIDKYFDRIHKHVICFVDKDLRLRSCHGDTDAILGIQCSSVNPGTLFCDLIATPQDGMRELIQSGEFALPIHLPDEQLLLGQFTAAANNDGYTIIIRDATDDIAALSELSERARELHTVFNTIGDPVFLIDLDGSIRNINNAAKEMYPGVDQKGKLIYNLIRQENEPSIEEPIQRCLAHFQPICTEQHLQGQNRTVQIHIYPILNAKHKIRQLLYMEHDITNERLMELEVRLQHQKLQDNYRRLRELDEAKTQWLNSVSHELRTPLTSIRSFSELLLTYDDTEPTTRKEFLEIIVKESERLSRLINDMLDLARIESGSMPWNPTTCDLVIMANETCATLSSIADKQDVYFDIKSNQDHVRMHTDPDRLQQVLVNLISNAIKFSPNGRPVLITIDADEDEVRIAVEDDGPGIPPEDRQKIFERFSQGTHSLSEKPHGTGLGLTISHHIIKFMGGQISVRDPSVLSGARLMAAIPRAISDLATTELEGQAQSL